MNKKEKEKKNVRESHKNLGDIFPFEDDLFAKVKKESPKKEKCECGEYIDRKYLKNYILLSLKHRKLESKKQFDTLDDGFLVTESALKSRLYTLGHQNDLGVDNLMDYMKTIRHSILNRIIIALDIHNSIKLNLVLHVILVDDDTKRTESFSIRLENESLYKESNLKEYLRKQTQLLVARSEEFFYYKYKMRIEERSWV